MWSIFLTTNNSHLSDIISVLPMKSNAALPIPPPFFTLYLLAFSGKKVILQKNYTVCNYYFLPTSNQSPSKFPTNYCFFYFGFFISVKYSVKVVTCKHLNGRVIHWLKINLGFCTLYISSSPNWKIGAKLAELEFSSN